MKLFALFHWNYSCQKALAKRTEEILIGAIRLVTGAAMEAVLAEGSHQCEERLALMFYSRCVFVLGLGFSNDGGFWETRIPGSCAPADCSTGFFQHRGTEDTEIIGEISPHLAALMQTNINVQSLTVEKAMTGKREHIYHAAMLNPHTAGELTLDENWSMANELIEAHGDYLPANN